ncbi:hypothetical protein lbkm_4211 [Lachnospiraceae bacterium KM106-2]|nr:hypothetical protein lbkm_4211 [Lachnospiraceae bacterium KM106-2]
MNVNMSEVRSVSQVNYGIKANTPQRMGGSIYAGDLSLTVQNALDKKIIAHKKSLKTVLDVYKGDNKDDTTIKDCTEENEKLATDNATSQKEIEALTSEQEKAREQYGITPDSKEEKDLELLKKQEYLKRSGRTELLTDDEKERLGNMDKLTDYQKDSLFRYNATLDYQDKIAANSSQIADNKGTIEGIEKARLRTHNMVDAKKEAEAINQSASQEMINSLVQDAKDKTDTEMEEEKKAAEEQNEKEEQTKENSSTDQVTEETSQFVDADLKSEKLQAAAQKLIDKKELLSEDVKGLEIDEQA